MLNGLETIEALRDQILDLAIHPLVDDEGWPERLVRDRVHTARKPTTDGLRLDDVWRALDRVRAHIISRETEGAA